MTEPTHTVEPLRVHLAGSDIKLTPPTPVVVRERYSTECRTIVLTADNPIAEIPFDYSRTQLFIQPLDFDIVLCHSYAQTQGKGNAAAASTPNPDGSYIPKTNTAPYGPLKGTDEMFITSVNNVTPFPNRVALTLTRCVYEP